MSTDLSGLLLRREVAARLRVSDATIEKWNNRGCKGLDGEIHRLKATRFIGRVYIHPDELESFLKAVAG